MGKIRPTRRRLAAFFNWTVRVQCFDRIWVGILMGCDKHMNLVLHQASEIRYYKVRGEPELKELKRSIGLIVLRGMEIITVTPEQEEAKKLVWRLPRQEKKNKKDVKKEEKKVDTNAAGVQNMVQLMQMRPPTLPPTMPMNPMMMMNPMMHMRPT